MFKPALGASVAGLFLLAGYSGGAPSAIFTPSTETPARVDTLATGPFASAYQPLKPQAAHVRMTTLAGAAHVHITQMITPANKPDVVVVTGVDKVSGTAFLAWSADRGESWTDLSSMLPANQIKDREPNAQVSSLMEDERGRLLLTMTDDGDAKGKVLVLTLGKKMDWLLL